MSEEELPDTSLTQLQPVIMPESTDEIIDTLELGRYENDLILRDDPMMSLNPLSNATYNSSLIELKKAKPIMYEMVHLVPQVYETSVHQKQQQQQQQQKPTFSYVDLAPAQVSEEDQKTAEQFIDKFVKTDTKVQTNTKPIKNEQEPLQTKIKRRKGREPAEKVYEKTAILDDPKAERKRINAILAKQNRDRQKNRLSELEAQVESLTRERDELQASTDKYRHRSQLFEEHLRKICKQFGVPIVIVTE